MQSTVQGLHCTKTVPFRRTLLWSTNLVLSLNCFYHSLLTRPFLVSSRNAPPHKRLLRTTFLFLCVSGLTNKPIMYKKLENTRAAGRKEANTLLNFRQINQSSLNQGRALCLQATKGLICRKVCFKRLTLTEFQVKKKGLIDLQDSFQDRLVLLILMRICMMNFMCRMCSLCCRTCDD